MPAALAARAHAREPRGDGGGREFHRSAVDRAIWIAPRNRSRREITSSVVGSAACPPARARGPRLRQVERRHVLDGEFRAALRGTTISWIGSLSGASGECKRGGGSSTRGPTRLRRPEPAAEARSHGRRPLDDRGGARPPARRFVAAATTAGGGSSSGADSAADRRGARRGSAPRDGHASSARLGSISVEWPRRSWICARPRIAARFSGAERRTVSSSSRASSYSPVSMSARPSVTRAER